MNDLYIRIERSGTREKRSARKDRVYVVTPEGEIDISSIVQGWTVTANANKGPELTTLQLLAVDIVDAPDVALIREATA